MSEEAQWSVVTEVGVGSGEFGTALRQAVQNGRVEMGCGDSVIL